ncbi:SpoIID/LytB domain-containing protein [Sulfoacidibacillus thermotolerans]|uniref:Sporulation stage II protein D amidase enhancer LytB N-terminal domain-containing protein n=1 Tax=Sulfoacidibacillus thermotolerans TaxID=1765684 RepID=A0A2U3DCB8_SULT2|nr:SpoIID/LytB domain-containing protein [Sulfoacidibacillus thermotolerans]PWI58933.1 hypothetical protein BM613_02330 [Sulfoacidibacillus thermotolerans]
MYKNQRRTLVSILTTLVFGTLCATLPANLAKAQTYMVGSTGFPSNIRVAIRETNSSGEPDPRGRIIYVSTVNFDQYCRDVLPNEWFPNWNPAALEAGAIAVKMFAWFHHLHPVTIDGYTFDVDNTVNFQTYRAQSDQPSTDQAYYATRNLAFVKPNKEIVELNYRAGYENNPNWQYRNAGIMAQWGSEYWANQGRTPLQILEFYYIGRMLTTIPGVGRS